MYLSFDIPICNVELWGYSLNTDILASHLMLMNAESRLYIHMAPFEEVVGVVKAIEINDSEVCAILASAYTKNVSIRFPKRALEAAILEQQLSKLLGRKVAILRIPDPQNPLRIRKVENKPEKRNVKTSGAKRTVNPMMR